MNFRKTPLRGTQGGGGYPQGLRPCTPLESDSSIKVEIHMTGMCNYWQKSPGCKDFFKFRAPVTPLK